MQALASQAWCEEFQCLQNVNSTQGLLVSESWIHSLNVLWSWKGFCLCLLINNLFFFVISEIYPVNKPEENIFRLSITCCFHLADNLTQNDFATWESSNNSSYYYYNNYCLLLLLELKYNLHEVKQCSVFSSINFCTYI